MTPFQKHVRKWSECTRCDLCKHRTKVVFVRGKLPCDILLVGEAPGASEDILGKPFMGPAGKLLDRMIGESFDPDTRYALTNLVGCIPKEESTKGEPTLQAIKACREKLLEVIGLAKPKAIVCVGTLSKRHTPVVEGVTQVALLHPAAILRMDVSQQGLAYQRCIVILRDVSEFVTVEGD